MLQPYTKPPFPKHMMVQNICVALGRPPTAVPRIKYKHTKAYPAGPNAEYVKLPRSHELM